MTIVPDKDSLYVGDVKINGATVRPFDPEQAGGALNISITSPIALAPGEGTISLGNFKKWDKKKSKFKDAGPGSITVTIGFDDGSTASVVVNK